MDEQSSLPSSCVLPDLEKCAMLLRMLGGQQRHFSALLCSHIDLVQLSVLKEDFAKSVLDAYVEGQQNLRAK